MLIFNGGSCNAPGGSLSDYAIVLDQKPTLFRGRRTVSVFHEFNQKMQRKVFKNASDGYAFSLIR